MNKNYKRKTENMQVIVSLNQTDDSSSSRNRLVNDSLNKLPLISINFSHFEQVSVLQE